MSAIQLFARQTAEDGVHPVDHFGKDLPAEDPPSNVDPDDEDFVPITSARTTTAGKPQAQASVQEISDDEEGFLLPSSPSELYSSNQPETRWCRNFGRRTIRHWSLRTH